MIKGIHRIARKNINTKDYWDKKFSEGKSANGTSACEDIMEYLKKTFPKDKDIVALDIGSGQMKEASFMVQIAEHFDNSTCFISDISSEICDTWKREDVKAERGVLPSLNYADDTFDLILCSHVLEHVTELELAIGEIKRIAKDGSMAIINSPLGPEWIGEEEHVWWIAEDADYGLGEIVTSFPGNQWHSMVQVYKVKK